MTDTSSVPEKKYFRIGEVSTLVEVDAHVLRYWETEFKIIKPYRGKSKQRLYRRKDVLNLLKIKNLLYEEGYTINGAKKFFTSRQRDKQNQVVSPPITSRKINEIPVLSEVKNELENILSLLNVK